MKRSPIKRQRRSSYSRRKRDFAFMSWIKEQPCIVRGCGNWDIEAAHCGDRAFGRKAEDRTCLPVCGEHHRTGPQAQHKLGRAFWSHFGIDRLDLIAKFNALYDIQNDVEQ